MCQFFSFLSDGQGSYYYADADLRKSGKLEQPDSHSALARHFLKNGAEDRLNAYEFNPLTKKFLKDKMNAKIDDSISAEKWCNEINWQRIAPELIVKPIINPFELPKRKPTKKDIKLLREWACVCAGARYNVWDSLSTSMRNSVWDSLSTSMRNSVWARVWYSVWDSVRASMMGSVMDSVWPSVWDSLSDSVGNAYYAYLASFFNIKYDHDFSSAVKLWERGLVPSFDGEIWRLHSGENADIVFQITQKKLMGA